MEHTFIVENIKCAGCEATIVKSLKKIPHVENVVVDIPGGTIKVSGDADFAHIQDKLSHLGYPVKGDNSVLLKAKSLVSCAIGRIARG